MTAVAVFVLGAGVAIGVWSRPAPAVRRRLVGGGSRLPVPSSVVERAWRRSLRALGLDRDSAAIERVLPEALDDLAGSLRAGCSLVQGLHDAAAASPPPLREELGRVVEAVHHGASLVDALDAWRRRCPLPAVLVAVAGLQLAVEVGGAQGEAVAALAATVRERAAVADDLRAAATQARASSIVLAVAPVGFAAVSGLVDPATLVATMRSTVGAGCLIAGIALDAAGAWWMLRSAACTPWSQT